MSNAKVLGYGIRFNCFFAPNTSLILVYKTEGITQRLINEYVSLVNTLKEIDAKKGYNRLAIIVRDYLDKGCIGVYRVKDERFYDACIDGEDVLCFKNLQDEEIRVLNRPTLYLPHIAVLTASFLVSPRPINDANDIFAKLLGKELWPDVEVGKDVLSYIIE